MTIPTTPLGLNIAMILLSFSLMRQVRALKEKNQRIITIRIFAPFIIKITSRWLRVCVEMEKGGKLKTISLITLHRFL
ncbi:hypothetical protein [Pseudodesulfovibrio sp.]|uniref:hypothetical protein n=1 Tax=unclassified Pseudodesulfovibrio TaxID=2661612 RepID=UPI003AFFCA7B